MTTFSIVTPTWNRADGRIQRCIKSIMAQQYNDFEHIIVDDGSTDGTEFIVNGYQEDDDRIKYIKVPHKGRVIARNEGMKAARYDWICWIDSDDAWDPMYLATFAHNIERNQEARLWVCGAIVHGVKKEDGHHTVPAWTQIRVAWMPPMDSDGVHSHFPSGRVGTGMFVFARECLDKTGLLPPWLNHNQIADGVDEWLGYVTGYNSATRLCGNPHGEDYCMFRKLTLFYRVYLIPAALYIHYVR